MKLFLLSIVVLHLLYSTQAAETADLATTAHQSACAPRCSRNARAVKRRCKKLIASGQSCTVTPCGRSGRGRSTAYKCVAGPAGTPTAAASPKPECVYTSTLSGASLEALCTCGTREAPVEISSSATDPAVLAKAEEYAKCVDEKLEDKCSRKFRKAVNKVKRGCCRSAGGTPGRRGSCTF